jgi:hypothetical protein
MVMDWRKAEQFLVEAFKAQGFQPNKSAGLSSPYAGDWIVQITESVDFNEEPAIIETINITSLAKELSASLVEIGV